MMLFAKKKMRYVTLSDSEQRLAKAALIQFRNALIAKGLPTEDVNTLLLNLNSGVFYHIHALKSFLFSYILH